MLPDLKQLHRRLHYLRTVLLQSDHYSAEKQEALEAYYIKKGLLTSDWAKEEEEEEEKEEQHEEPPALVATPRCGSNQADAVEEEFDSDDEERIPMAEQWPSDKVQEKTSWGHLDGPAPSNLPLLDTPRVVESVKPVEKEALLDILIDLYMAGLEPDMDYEHIDHQDLEQAADEKEKLWDQADAYFDTD